MGVRVCVCVCVSLCVCVCVCVCIAPALQTPAVQLEWGLCLTRAIRVFRRPMRRRNGSIFVGRGLLAQEL